MRAQPGNRSRGADPTRIYPISDISCDHQNLDGSVESSTTLSTRQKQRYAPRSPQGEEGWVEARTSIRVRPLLDMEELFRRILESEKRKETVRTAN